MFGNMIGLAGFWGSGFKCEDLILVCFYHQMLNDKMLKPNNEMKMPILTQAGNRK